LVVPIVTLQVFPLELVQPLQLTVELESGVAVSATAVPLPKVALQVPPKLEQPAIPAGEELTEPPPVPAMVTSSVSGIRSR
jgi:hypothetical protein